MTENSQDRWCVYRAARESVVTATLFVDHDVCLASATVIERAEHCDEKTEFRFHLQFRFFTATGQHGHLVYAHSIWQRISPHTQTIGDFAFDSCVSPLQIGNGCLRHGFLEHSCIYGERM